MDKLNRLDWLFLAALIALTVSVILVARYHALDPICACELNGKTECACFERTLEDKKKTLPH